MNLVLWSFPLSTSKLSLNPYPLQMGAHEWPLEPFPFKEYGYRSLSFSQCYLGFKFFFFSINVNTRRSDLCYWSSSSSSFCAFKGFLLKRFCHLWSKGVLVGGSEPGQRVMDDGSGVIDLHIPKDFQDPQMKTGLILFHFNLHKWVVASLDFFIKSSETCFWSFPHMLHSIYIGIYVLVLGAYIISNGSSIVKVMMLFLMLSNQKQMRCIIWSQKPNGITYF